VTLAIEVESLTHRYRRGPDEVHVLDRLSVEIQHGQFVSLIGPSGCGKTTVLDVLTGLLTGQQGTVLVNGSPPVAGRPDVARMFARDALLPWLSASGNVEFALRTRMEDQRRRSEIIKQLLQAVGLTGFEKTFPRQLSQGMRQRVALARTFALPSDFVFLDEPFGAVDAQTKLVLQDQLLNLWEQAASTVVLVTHDLAEAVALSDRVIVMSARPGRIVADVPIELPRPRSVRHLQKERAYHDVYSRLWEELERGSSAELVT
jgi:NitT/TauT family transport system ATP-binding protein